MPTSPLHPESAPDVALDERAMSDDPMAECRAWYALARERMGDAADAMTLATADASGRPSARMVLLRGLDDGFRFFTNYGSRKGAELGANPAAAIVLWWPPLARQLRAEGRVVRVSRADSEAYFRSRPVGSRLSAIVSPQSRVVPDRAWLEARVRERAEARDHSERRCPEDWGGYRLVPEAVEFWQSGRHRLHDRVRYRRTPDGWVRERLAP